jgi:preprotein translocase subunit SecD
LHRVLSWWVRIPIIVLLLAAIFVDGAGYWYRLSNHYPLTGDVPGLPPTFNGWQLYIHKGLDLSGGTRLVLQMRNVPPGQNRQDVQSRTIQVIQKRINALGVSEPRVEASGNDRINVELAGVSSDKAQQVIGKTAQLVTTQWVKDSSITNGPVPGYRPKITNLRSDMLTSATASLDQSGANSWVVNVSLNSQGAQIFGDISTAAYNACPGQGNDCPERHVAEWLDLTQDDVTHWQDRANQLSAGTDAGGKLLTNPTMDQPITGGQFFISGKFTPDSAKSLATLLNSGSLPVTLDILQSSDVDATLGQDSIRASLAAGLLGLVIVILFMIILYRIPGALASIALLFYAGVVLMLFKTIPVTLSLAGMAGFILSVGMAVDANVLIFERFKEEMRAGRTIAGAVDAAVRRAWPAVRDSNTATLITSAVLFFVGQAVNAGPVQGFALTLMVGVLVSLISSIIVTHNLLAIVLAFGWTRKSPLLGVARGHS